MILIYRYNAFTKYNMILLLTLDNYIYVRHPIPAKPTLGSAGPNSFAQNAALATATQSNPTK